MVDEVLNSNQKIIKDIPPPISENNGWDLVSWGKEAVKEGDRGGSDTPDLPSLIPLTYVHVCKSYVTYKRALFLCPWCPAELSPLEIIEQKRDAEKLKRRKERKEKKRGVRKTCIHNYNTVILVLLIT